MQQGRLASWPSAVMVGRISRRAMAASRDAGSSSDVLPKDRRGGRSRDSDLRVDRLGRKEGHGLDGGVQARPTVADPRGSRNMRQRMAMRRRSAAVDCGGHTWTDFDAFIK